MVYKTSAFRFDDVDNLPFDPETYSKMKFGSRKASLQCAHDTASAFIWFLRDNRRWLTKPIVVAQVPTKKYQKAVFIFLNLLLIL